jgi:oxygen-dependent protoporphyrinogen oxidase
MKRVVIIGGGISGLSAAFHLEKARKAGADLSYTLIESGKRLGGSMYSSRVAGCLVEAGPDSFLTKAVGADAIQERRHDDQLIGSNDSQRKTYIVVKPADCNARRPDVMVPTKLVPTALSPLFSWGQSCAWRRS